MEEPRPLLLCELVGDRRCFQIRADGHIHMVERGTSVGHHVGGGQHEGCTHWGRKERAAGTCLVEQLLEQEELPALLAGWG